MAFHILLWTTLIIAFVVFSVPVVGPAVAQNALGPLDPAHSVDNYLKGLTGTKKASQLLPEIFARLPARKELLVVVNEKSSPSEFLGMLVCYLAWPRDVGIVKVDGATAGPEIVPSDRSSVAGLIFCFVQPPPVQKRIELGGGLILIPAGEVDLAP